MRPAPLALAVILLVAPASASAGGFGFSATGSRSSLSRPAGATKNPFLRHGDVHDRIRDELLRERTLGGPFVRPFHMKGAPPARTGWALLTSDPRLTALGRGVGRAWEDARTGWLRFVEPQRAAKPVATQLAVGDLLRRAVAETSAAWGTFVSGRRVWPPASAVRPTGLETAR